MNYSDYFETKVSARLNDTVDVTLSDSANTILDVFTIGREEVEATLAKYDHYKAELSEGSVTIYIAY